MGKRFLSLILFILIVLSLLSPAHKPAKATEELRWRHMFSGTEYALWDVWGSSPSDVFAVGEGGIILYYDGTNWSEMKHSIICELRGIWGSSSANVFAVGQTRSSEEGAILHYDGTSWTLMDTDISGSLSDVWGTSSSDVFTIGSRGTILHYDGCNWTKMENSNPMTYMQAVWGSSSSNVFAVGYSDSPNVSNMLHYDGTSWQAMNSGTTNKLFSIWGTSSSDVFAVGDSTILHYDGTSWQLMNHGFNIAFRGIWGSSSTDVYAVAFAAVFHYDGTLWSQVVSESSIFYDVWGHSAVGIFAVGQEGKILYYGNQQIQAICVVSIREEWGKETVADFDAAVGESITHYAFSYWWDSFLTNKPDITYTHDNSDFSFQQLPSGGPPLFTFSPTKPGISVDNVTLTSNIGTVSFKIIGNGIPAENPEYWIADLPLDTSAERLLYDPLRQYLYMSDSNKDRVIVFSPEQRCIVTTITVGRKPIGLAITPNKQYLYVANSGESSISEIDLGSMTEIRRFLLPSLGIFTGYTPYCITMVNGNLLFIGSRPPGSASGGPIYQLDLNSYILTPRDDIGSGIRPVLCTSTDLSTTAIALEPGASPTVIVRYDVATDSFISSYYNNIESDVIINRDGTKMIATNNESSTFLSDLRLFDRSLTNIKRVDLLGLKALQPVFHPSGKYVYATRDFTPFSIQEVDLDTLTQVRDLRVPKPTDYYPFGGYPQTSAISSDGLWFYALLVRTWNEPPSKLLAVKINRSVGPPEIGYSTNTLTFHAIENGENPTGKVLEVYNAGYKAMNWQLNDDATWLTVTPTSGISFGEHSTININVDISGMHAGDYSATITLTSAEATNSPQYIPVNLSIALLPLGANNGDINADGRVNILDLIAVGSAFNSHSGDANWRPDADINEDGIIDINDLVVVGMNFYRHATGH